MKGELQDVSYSSHVIKQPFMMPDNLADLAASIGALVRCLPDGRGEESKVYR